MTIPIPVRKMHDDGFITVRYLNPDGTPFEDELPEELLFAATPHTITAIWEYGIGDASRLMNGKQTLANLMYLSDTAPLVFDALLESFQNLPENARMVWGEWITSKVLHPMTKSSTVNYVQTYEMLMQAIPVAAELVGPNWRGASDLVSKARNTLNSLTHEHLAATVLSIWAFNDYERMKKLKYSKHVDDIAFINENLEAAMRVRYSIKRTGTIDRNVVRDLIDPCAAQTPSFSHGVSKRALQQLALTLSIK